jgi:hypothetical protein
MENHFAVNVFQFKVIGYFAHMVTLVTKGGESHKKALKEKRFFSLYLFYDK